MTSNEHAGEGCLLQFCIECCFSWCFFALATYNPAYQAFDKPLTNEAVEVELPYSFPAVVNFLYFLYTGTLPSNLLHGSNIDASTAQMPVNTGDNAPQTTTSDRVDTDDDILWRYELMLEMLHMYVYGILSIHNCARFAFVHGHHGVGVVMQVGEVACHSTQRAIAKCDPSNARHGLMPANIS